MSRYGNYKPCAYDRQKIIGFIYIPNPQKYMCKSIRQYYTKIQLIAQGYSKEKAEEITKIMVG